MSYGLRGVENITRLSDFRIRLACLKIVRYNFLWAIHEWEGKEVNVVQAHPSGVFSKNSFPHDV
jgi:hypothetical protein